MQRHCGYVYRQYLVAGDSLLVLIVLSKHVSQATPCRGVCVINAQRLAVALLRCLPANLPLGSPQVPQVVMHINLWATQPTIGKGQGLALWHFGKGWGLARDRVWQGTGFVKEGFRFVSGLV